LEKRDSSPAGSRGVARGWGRSARRVRAGYGAGPFLGFGSANSPAIDKINSNLSQLADGNRIINEKLADGDGRLYQV
jgi:hypothetical protein